MNDKVVGSRMGIAVVTGASSGIGRVYADRLAKRGYDLVLVARRGELLESVSATFRAAYGVSVEAIVADLAIASDLDRVAERLLTLENVTMLVNNAGTSTMGHSDATSAAQMEAMIALNITALSRLSLAILPVFKKRNSGTLINMGSILGFHSLPITAVYSATKGYVLNFTRGLQDELAGTGVVVQLVAPARTATDLWDYAGVPLNSLDESTLMTVENCVDAALAGLDQGEKITVPPMEDASLLTDYDVARMKLLGAVQTGKPASRYGIAI